MWLTNKMSICKVKNLALLLNFVELEVIFAPLVNIVASYWPIICRRTAGKKEIIAKFDLFSK